jgi:hypothetical protein
VAYLTGKKGNNDLQIFTNMSDKKVLKNLASFCGRKKMQKVCQKVQRMQLQYVKSANDNMYI